MKFPVILVSVAVLLLALGCTGDRRRGSSGSRGGDPTGASQPRPGAGTPICSNTCEWAQNGICEDGATGSTSARCERGTDCADCGTRYDSTTAGESSGSADEDAGIIPPAPAGCECDYYAGECECDCDPDCADVSGSSGSTGTRGFADSCDCLDDVTGGYCASNDCADGLECFRLEGWDFCTTPCSSMDVGSYDVCPSGGVCSEVEVLPSVPYDVCTPT